MAEIIYSKYSNERCRRFAVRTDILEENGARYVEKTALYPEGKAHVEALEKWYQSLSALYQTVPYECNRCRFLADENKVRLEYVTGKTLEEELDELLLGGKKEEASARLLAYLRQAERLFSGEDFRETPEFAEVFGEIHLPEGLKCGKVTNIDMICGNLVLAETPIVLDYEWTFDFPVPGKFVLYRIIHYYIYSGSIKKELQADDFYREMGISKELLHSFEKMETSFQQYITMGHVPMRDMYTDMTPGEIYVTDSVREYLQIYFDLGKGYSEEKSVSFYIKGEKVSAKLRLPKGCAHIRIDPGSRPCAVQIEELIVDGAAIPVKDEYLTEGNTDGKWVYLPCEDPNLAGIPVPEGAAELAISLRVLPASEEIIRGMCRLSGENACLRIRVRKQSQIIRDMSNTKVWKLYQKYRNAVERKK